MADRGIIFSAPMVRALLDRRKTQTRRIVKNVPDAPAMDNIAWPDKKLHPAPYVDAYCGARMTPENPRGMTANWAYWTRDDRPGPLFKVGYVPGDRLWVREGWAMVPYTAYLHSDGVQMTAHAGTHEAAIYRASFDRSQSGIRWRSPIHMPRWASRITLIVTDVRVQRLQEISEADAVAEGVAVGTATGAPLYHAGLGRMDCDWCDDATDAFAALWNSIHGSDAWDADPWVCALTFTVHRCNIDVVSAEASA